MMKDAEQLHAKDRKVWRKWLEKNHLRAGSVWLILYKKNSAPCIQYQEAVEEALCFGWIDSKANKRDDMSHIQYFAARKPRSPWSKLNKQRIKKLLKEGRMAPSGLEKIKVAKKDGSWYSLDDIEKLIMPVDLKREMVKKKIAISNFEAFPPSVKKGIYHWIQSAKREETRTKRIKETVRLASKNLRANEWVKKSPQIGLITTEKFIRAHL